MKKSLLSLTVLTMLLTGCGTMNSNFSCNATAGDSCLSIEEVDSMTRFADGESPYSPRQGLMKAGKGGTDQGSLVKQKNGQDLWLANKAKEQPWG